MFFAHGSLTWLAADAATTTYTVSGLTFQPKAIRFYWMGMGSSTDAQSTSLDIRRGVGFAVGTSSRRCVAARDQVSQTTTSCFTGARNDAIAGTITTGAFDGLLDLSAINSDGFTLIVDDQGVVDIRIFWEAWGGDDITVAAVGDIAEPSGTPPIDVDYTVTGFVSGATDQVVMFAGVQSVTAVNNSEQEASGLYVGFATSGADADNVVVTGSQDSGSASADTDGYCKTGECLAQIALAGGNPNARAKMTQFNTDGFRLNWLARNNTNRRSIFLAIKGGAWKAGAYTINGNTGSATATVSGLSFTPLGVCLMGRMTAEQSAGTSTTQDRISLGTGSSTSSRRAMGALSEDGTDPNEIDHAIEYDQVLVFPSTTGGVQAAYDINAMNSDGFQIIVDTAGGVASEWQGYLTFGSASVSLTPPVGALTLAGFAPTLGHGLTPGVGALALAGLAPLVSLGDVRTPPPGALVLEGHAPQVSIGTVITPDAGALVLTGFEPTVQVEAGGSPTITPPAGTLALTGHAPAMDLGLTPSVGMLALTGYAPSLGFGITIPVGELALTGFAPIVSMGIVLTPPAGALLLEGFAPRISVGTVITPPAGTLTFDGFAPTLGLGITPPAGALLFEGFPPLLGGELVLIPPAGTLALQGYAPSIGIGVTPPPGALTLVGAAPSLGFGITPGAGSLAVQGYAPALGFGITPGVGALTLAGVVPVLSFGTVITPPPGALTLEGAAPVAALGFFITPGPGALTLVGFAPMVVAPPQAEYGWIRAKNLARTTSQGVGAALTRSEGRDVEIES